MAYAPPEVLFGNVPFDPQVSIAATLRSVRGFGLLYNLKHLVILFLFLEMKPALRKEKNTARKLGGGP
jgi:hypothetical protein